MLAAQAAQADFSLLRKPNVQFDFREPYAAIDAALGLFDGFSCRKMHQCAFS
jgi:hypothetical protein